MSTMSVCRDGMTLEARCWGPADGPAIILQHGRGDDGCTWSTIGEHLSTVHGYRVIAPDLRGHGASAWDPEGRYDIDTLAADFGEWLSAAGERSTVVAHSFGAAVALTASARYPSRVRGLVLEDGGPASEKLIDRWDRHGAVPVQAWVADEDEALAEMERLWPGDTTEDNRERRLAAFFRPARRGGLEWRCDMPRMAALPRDKALLEGSWQAFGEISCPMTLIVAGTPGASMLGPDVVRRARAVRPATEVFVVDDAGHNVHRDQPDRYCRILDSFVARNLEVNR